jgi:hypothetical protein
MVEILSTPRAWCQASSGCHLRLGSHSNIAAALRHNAGDATRSLVFLDITHEPPLRHYAETPAPTLSLPALHSIPDASEARGAWWHQLLRRRRERVHERREDAGNRRTGEPGNQAGGGEARGDCRSNASCGCPRRGGRESGGGQGNERRLTFRGPAPGRGRRRFRSQLGQDRTACG